MLSMLSNVRDSCLSASNEPCETLNTEWTRLCNLLIVDAKKIAINTKASEPTQEEKKSNIVQKAGETKFTRDALSDPKKSWQLTYHLSLYCWSTE